MRKLIVTEFVSLDGVMEAPGGEAGHPHSGWVFPYHGPGTLQYKSDELAECDAQLLGRVTYEGFAAAWPQREGEFADKMNQMPKYVVSSTLKDPAWDNTTVLDGGVPGGVAELKRGEGGSILVAGSKTLVHSLIEHDLVDEYHLMVFPVLLGSGKRVFPESPDKRALELVDVQTFEKGVQVQTLRPA